MPRSSSRASSQAIISRFLFAAVILPCLALPSTAKAAAKDTAPAWLHELAQGPIPSHDDDAVAVVLLDDTETTVRDNGDIQTLHRVAFKILRPEARQRFGRVAVDFDKDTKVAYVRAWTITSGGRDLAVSEKDAVEHGFLDDIEYTDTKVKVLSFPEVSPGNVIGYEYLRQERPYVFEDAWDFQRTVPVKTARFDLHIPPGWEFTAQWFNHADQNPQVNGANEYVWQMNDLPAVRTEPQMPPFQAVAGWMGIKFFPRDPNLRSKSAGSWSDIGLWFNGLTTSSRQSNPAIHQKVMELTAGASDPLAKMRALTEYMQRQIRYFAVEIGIGGYQPHTAADVFQRQWGDCKDKATLLSTMLSEIGVESYYVAVDDFRDGVRPDYPSIRFNHMILAIRLPADVDDKSLSSVLNDPKLGKLIIFDPTNTYVPLGYLPSYEQNTYGLVMGVDGGTLVRLPLASPASNRLSRTAQLSLSNSGVLSGQVEEVRWGDPASGGRREYGGIQPAKRPEILENFLQRSLPNFVLSEANIGDLEQLNSSLKLDYKFVSQGYARMAGNELLLRPQVIEDTYADTRNLFSQEKPRQYGIEFESTAQQDDVFDISLPAGYALEERPFETNISCDFATYSSKMEVKGNVLHYVRSLQIKDVHVPKENLADLKDFLQKVAASQAMFVALRPAN